MEAGNATSHTVVQTLLQTLTPRGVLHQLVLLLLALYMANTVATKMLSPAAVLIGLVMVLPPSVSQLASFNSRARDKIKRSDGDEVEDFTIPASSQLNVNKKIVSPVDVGQLRYYDSISETMLLTLLSLFSTAIGVGYQATIARQGSSLFGAQLIGAVAALNAIRILASLFLAGGSSERVLGVSLGFMSLMGTALLLLPGQSYLDFDFQQVYHNVGKVFLNFQEELDLDVVGGKRSVDLRTIKLLFAIMSGAIAVLLTLPAFRFARSVQPAIVAYADGKPLTEFLLRVDFVLPVLLSICWLRPIVDLVTTRLGLSREVFQLMRALLGVLPLVVRLSTIRMHLQCFLNVAEQRIDELFKDATDKKGSNRNRVQASDIQAQALNIWQYSAVAALQYLLPPVILACLSFSALSASAADAESVTASAAQLTLGYVTWWTSTATFVLSGLGLIFMRWGDRRD